MPLAITILSGVVVVLLAVFGFTRNIRRGIAALVGTLLGATIVDFWSAVWAQQLSVMIASSSRNVLTIVVSLTAFVLTVLFVGYGGASLLGSGREKTWGRQAVSTLLGALNGAVISAYVIRYVAYNNGRFIENVQDSPVGRVLYTGLPYLFLIVAAVVTVIVLIRMLINVLGVKKPTMPAMPTMPTIKLPSLGKDNATTTTPATPPAKPEQKPLGVPSTPPGSSSAPKPTTPSAAATLDQKVLEKLKDKVG